MNPRHGNTRTDPSHGRHACPMRGWPQLAHSGRRTLRQESKPHSQPDSSSTATLKALGTESTHQRGRNVKAGAHGAPGVDCAGGSGTSGSRAALQRRQLLMAAAHAATGAAWPLTAIADPAAASSANASTTPAAPPRAASLLQPLLPSPAPDLLAQLEGRTPIYQPGVAWSLRNRDRQLFYPAWLVGEWEVTARFAAASFPQGRRLLGRTVPGVLKGSMVVALPDVGAAMEAPVRYRARFVSSLQEGGVVADRVFNVQQLMDAFYGFEVTRRVEYEPLKNPTRLTVVYATPRQDKSVISEDLRKAELIINNRLSEQLSPTDFTCAELFRQISQASAQGFVGDYETISRYTLQSTRPLLQPQPQAAATAGDEGGGVPSAQQTQLQGSVVTPLPAPAVGSPSAEITSPRASETPGTDVGARVRVLQRVAAFLQPQDAAFFEAGNQAVAVYDYTYDMVRMV